MIMSKRSVVPLRGGHLAVPGIYADLRDQIVSTALEPGASLSEVRIAELYGVSRTPVREAFKRLADDGLLDVTIVPPLEGDLLATVGTAMAEGKDAALDRVAIRCALPWVDVTATEPLTLNLDGEPVEATRFRIECMSGRLRMHLPADCPLRGNAAKVAA